LGDSWIGADPSPSSSELPGYFPRSFPVEREHSPDAKHSQETGTTPLPSVTTPPDEGHLHTDDVASTVVRHPVPALPPGLPLVTPGVRVLVVDDDPLTRTLMKRMLTRMGCNVSTAENGKMAVDMLLGSPSTTDASDAQEFSVVFMDNQMPVMSGLHAISKLRQIGRRDFVVGVTGNPKVLEKTSIELIHRM
jgi:osomolarity two-component system sensor histidine kinase SLN1